MVHHVDAGGSARRTAIRERESRLEGAEIRANLMAAETRAHFQGRNPVYWLTAIPYPNVIYSVCNNGWWQSLVPVPSCTT
jgi:hypothetical protein